MPSARAVVLSIKAAARRKLIIFFIIMCSPFINIESAAIIDSIIIQRLKGEEKSFSAFSCKLCLSNICREPASKTRPHRRGANAGGILVRPDQLIAHGTIL